MNSTNLIGFASAIPALVLLTGCLGLEPKPDPTRFYVLSGRQEALRTDPGTAADRRPLFLAAIETPLYLDDTRIAVRQDASRIEYAEFDRWAEPVRDGVSRALRDNLSARLGVGALASPARVVPRSNAIELQLRFQAFEIRNDQHAVLRAVWRLRDAASDTILHSQDSAFEKPFSGGSREFGPGVQALSEVLAELSDEIARAVADLPRSRSSQPGG